MYLVRKHYPIPLLTHRLPDLPSFIKGAPGSDLSQLLGDWLPRTAQRDPLSHHLSQKWPGPLRLLWPSVWSTAGTRLLLQSLDRKYIVYLEGIISQAWNRECNTWFSYLSSCNCWKHSFKMTPGEINALLKLRNRPYSRIVLIRSICVQIFHWGSRNGEPLGKSEPSASPWTLGSSLCYSRSFQMSMFYYFSSLGKHMFTADNTWILPRKVNRTSWLRFLKLFY